MISLGPTLTGHDSARDLSGVGYFQTLRPSSCARIDAEFGVTTELKRDPRWIVLGEDGKFITLGRATDPSAEEIALAEERLRGDGLAGWLAIMSGSAYSHHAPTVTMVRPLADPKGSFNAAADAFRAAHSRKLRNDRPNMAGAQ